MELLKRKNTSRTADFSSEGDDDSGAAVSSSLPSCWTIGMYNKNKQHGYSNVLWKTFVVEEAQGVETIVAEFKSVYQKESIIVFNSEGIPVFFSSVFSAIHSDLFLFAREHLG